MAKFWCGFSLMVSNALRRSVGILLTDCRKTISIRLPNKPRALLRFVRASDTHSTSILLVDTN